MAEESKQAFDPDATVAQPASPANADADPEATVTLPVAAPRAGADPEATVTGPLAKPDTDLEATDRRPVFDPEATFTPAERARLDPEATVRIPSPGKLRSNPFAPKAAPESIHANLSSLGGLNPLVAMANPVLAAVPQIRRTLKHPDAAGLRAKLQGQIEALETSAISAEVTDDTVAAAVYALCALLDESAAATPWGGDWIQHGLLQEMRGESGGAEGFFAKLEQASAEPDKNADLLEFFYICLVLGFEGRYRGAEGGRQALDQIKDRLYGLIALRRPRPEGLSERWRTPAAQAAAAAALATAERVTALRAAAEAAARAGAAATVREAPAFSLARLPRRAIWSAVAGIVGASIVLYLLGLRLLEDQSKAALAAKPNYRTKSDAGAGASGAAPQPGAGTAAATLSGALAGLPVTVSAGASGVTVTLRHDRQFASGSTLPAPAVHALLGKLAAALDKLPGAIVVIGHADATPPGARYASNAELSAARARAAARLLARGLGDAKRLASEGKGDTEPLAPNDTPVNRAKNRRISILLKPAP